LSTKVTNRVRSKEHRPSTVFPVVWILESWDKGRSLSDDFVEAQNEKCDNCFPSKGEDWAQENTRFGFGNKEKVEP